jgi:hypothetical protein
MHKFCFEHSFRYQIFHNNKDPNNSTILWCKLIMILILPQVKIQSIGYPICTQYVPNMYSTYAEKWVPDMCMICILYIGRFVLLSISSIISAFSNRRRIQHSSLEPPRRAASNGGGFNLLRSLDAEIIDETLTIRHLTFMLLRHLPIRRLSRHPVIVEG